MFFKTNKCIFTGLRMKAFTMQSKNKIGAWAHMRPPLCNFCRSIEDIEILFLARLACTKYSKSYCSHIGVGVSVGVGVAQNVKVFG